MQFTWQPQKRGIRLIVEDRHVKTVPKKMFVLVTTITIQNLSFDKKRLSATERKTLIDASHYIFWRMALEDEEPLIHELITNSNPIARRTVKNHNGTRREIIFDNNVKVKVPDKVYFSLLKLEETTACLNY